MKERGGIRSNSKTRSSSRNIRVPREARPTKIELKSQRVIKNGKLKRGRYQIYKKKNCVKKKKRESGLRDPYLSP